MKNQKLKDIGFALLVIGCLLAICWGYYSYNSFTAERYNEQLGTSYTAVDIMMGIHKTARDWR